LSHQQPSDEQDLLRRLQNGDTEAFHRVVREQQRRVYALAFDLTGNHADAEDIAQETFIKAWRNIKQFRGEAQISTWLHRIAVTTFVDWKRSTAAKFQKNSIEHTENSHALPAKTHADTSPDNALDGQFINDYIQRALRTLSPQQQVVFTLRYYHDKPLLEIAATLGVTEGTVKTLHFRAVRAMRDLLAPVKELFP
jgi:RNA polymerase sigma-70 factor, ECF subfamily